MWGTAFFLSFYALPAVLPVPAVSLAAAAALAAVALRMSYVAETGGLHRYWLYAGSAAPLLVIVGLQAMRPDAERLLVLVFGVLLLVFAFRRLR